MSGPGNGLTMYEVGSTNGRFVRHFRCITIIRRRTTYVAPVRFSGLVRWGNGDMYEDCEPFLDIAWDNVINLHENWL